MPGNRKNRLIVEIPFGVNFEQYRHVLTLIAEHVDADIKIKKLKNSSCYKIWSKGCHTKVVQINADNMRHDVCSLRKHEVLMGDVLMPILTYTESFEIGTQLEDIISPLVDLLCLREERENLHRDIFGLVEGHNSPRHKMGALSEPFFENAALLVAFLLGIKQPIRYPDNKTWAVAVSCDIDSLDKDHIPAVINTLSGYKVTRPTFMICSANDQERNMRDPQYDMADEKTLCKLSPLLDADVEIGLHGSYLAYDNGSMLFAQKKRIEDWAGREVIGHRAHFYRFAYPRSWSWQLRAGFKYDASLGYPDLPGLRNGSASPTRYYDPELGSSDLYVFTTCILDQHFYHPVKLDDRYVKNYVDELLKNVKKVGGVLTLDWHTYTLEDYGWWNWLEYIIKQAQENDAYVSGIGHIYNHIAGIDR